MMLEVLLIIILLPIALGALWITAHMIMWALEPTPEEVRKRAEAAAHKQWMRENKPKSDVSVSFWLTLALIVIALMIFSSTL